MVAERGSESVIMAEGRIAKRQKEAAKLKVQELILALEDEVDAENCTLSSIEIHSKLKELSKYFQLYQNLSANYGEYLENEAHASHMAKLQQECRDIEEQFVEIQTMAVDYINRTQLPKPAESSQTVIKAKLFKNVIPNDYLADVVMPFKECRSGYQTLEGFHELELQSDSFERQYRKVPSHDSLDRNPVKENMTPSAPPGSTAMSGSFVMSGATLPSVGSYRDFAVEIGATSYMEHKRRLREAEKTAEIKRLNPIP